MMMLLLVVVLSFGISFSRYTNIISNSGDLTSVVIVKDYNLDADWGSHPATVQYPGISDQIYNFSLHNTKVNDLYYIITISLRWNENTPVIGLNVPLDINLYIVNPDNSLTPVTTTAMQTVVAGRQINDFYTAKAAITGNQSINFRILWSWGTTAADRNYSFANKDIDIRVNVKAEQ
jgi:hypothetical protein